MICPNCKNKNAKGDAFCQKCGTKLTAPEKKTDIQDGGKLNIKLVAASGGVLLLTLIVLMTTVLAAVIGKKDKEEITAVIPAAENSDMDTVSENSNYWSQNISTGDIVEFGFYEQDGKTSNGAEPIEWIVTSCNGNNYLLISKYILDCQPYGDGYVYYAEASGLQHDGLVYYQNSYIRKWISEDFVEQAFGEREMKYLLPVSVKDDGITAISGNTYATDYAFIPDLVELRDNIADCYSHGEEDGYNLLRAKEWRCAATEYAKSKGCDPQDGYSNYWIRDRFHDQKVAVDHSYCVDFDGFGRHKSMMNYYGVRPAIYVTVENKTVVTAEGEAAKEHLAEHMGKKYISEDEEHILKFDRIYIKTDCDEHLITAIPDEVENEPIILCLEAYLDIRNFVYAEVDGLDCYTSEKYQMKLTYDKSAGIWRSYLKTDKMTEEAGVAKGEWVQINEYFSK